MSISTRVDDILFLRKIEALGLKPMWDYICQNNAGRNNPYHNTEHMFGAAKLGWKLWEAEVAEGELPDDSPEFRMVDVIVALLWHDFDHSGGRLSDAENIEDAIAAFNHFLDLPEFADINMKLGYYADRAHVVEELIRVTEFPFVHEPRFLAEKIVRDADLLYSFSEHAGPILKGLYDELSDIGRLPSGMTFLDMVQGQHKFHDEVQLFTAAGLAIHTDLKAEVIHQQLAYSLRLMGEV